MIMALPGSYIDIWILFMFRGWLQRAMHFMFFGLTMPAWQGIPIVSHFKHPFEPFVILNDACWTLGICWPGSS